MPKIRNASVFVILPSNPPRWYFALLQACNRVFILNTDGFGKCFRCCCTRLVIAGNVLAINLPVKPAVASPNPVYIIEVAITTITFWLNAREIISEKLCFVDSSSAKYKESSGLIQLGKLFMFTKCLFIDMFWKLLLIRVAITKLAVQRSWISQYF